MLFELQSVNQISSYDKQIKFDREEERKLSCVEKKLRNVCFLPSNDYTKQYAELQNQIKNLTKELNQINRELFLGVTYRNTYKKHLKILKTQIEYQNTLDKERMITELEIGHVESQLNRLNKEESRLLKVFTDFEYRETLKRNRFNLETAERNLNLSKIKEGKLIAENVKLKSIIASMLHDRNVFNKTWHEKIVQLVANKKFLVDMIERGLIAIKQSEDLSYKIMDIKKRAENDKTAHVDDMIKMRRRLERDDVYHAFLAKKGFRREMFGDQDIRRRDMKEKELRKDLQLYHKVIDKVIEKFDFDSNKAERNSETKSKISDHLPEILSEFKKNKDLYFARFSYTQILNHSCQYLSELMNDIEKNLYDQKSKNTCQRVSQNRKEAYDALTKAKSKTSDFLEKLKTKDASLKSILLKIQNMCNIVGCDTRFMKNLLGDYKQVTQFNIKLFLSSLEKQVNTILAYIYYIQKDSETKELMMSLITKNPPLTNVTKVVTQNQCSECAKQKNVKAYEETIVRPMSRNTVEKLVKENAEQPDFGFRLHSLSQCRLPDSRRLVNKRYT